MLTFPNAHTPNVGRLRQEDHCELEGILDYRM